MASGDAITDVFDLSGNGKGAALNVHPRSVMIIEGLVPTKAELLMPTATELITYTLNEADTVNRLMRVKLGESISLKDFAGVTGNNVADDAVGVQRAVALCGLLGKQLFVPAVPVAYRLGSAITMVNASRMYGEGCNIYKDVVGARGPGSWFRFDHLGKGFHVIGNGDGGLTGGSIFGRIGTFRNQPVPANGVPYVPILADYDFDINNGDVFLDDVMCYNPTKMVRQSNGGAGRLYTNRLRGQPLEIGVHIEQSYDGYVANDTRLWNFFSVHPEVIKRTLLNRKGHWLQHCDNPSIKGLFDIYSRFPVFFGASASGPTSRAQFVAPEFDQVGEAAFYTEVGTDGVTFQVLGGYSLGSNEAYCPVAQMCLTTAGSNAIMSLTDHRITRMNGSGATLNGAGNKLIITKPDVDLWNRSNAAYPAWAAGGTNRILVTTEGFYGDGNGAPRVSDAARIASPEVLTSTVIPTTSVGVLTSATATHEFTRSNEFVEGKVTISIPTNGTGSGVLSVPLPIATAVGTTDTAGGRETNVNGFWHGCSLAGPDMSVQVGHTNAYPGVNNFALVVRYKYRVDKLI